MPDEKRDSNESNNENETMKQEQEYQIVGDIRVTDEVIAIIAGIAATEVDGVAGMSGGIAGGIAEMLGRKNMTKGVRVEAGEKETVIDVFIIVDYGYRIPDVAWGIQEKVKEDVESMTGMKVLEVNIHIQGVRMENKDQKEQKDVKEQQETN